MTATLPETSVRDLVTGLALALTTPGDSDTQRVRHALNLLRELATNVGDANAIDVIDERGPRDTLGLPHLDYPAKFTPRHSVRTCNVVGCTACESAGEDGRGWL